MSTSADSVQMTNTWAANVRNSAGSHTQLSSTEVLEGCLEQLQNIWLDDRLTDKKTKIEAVYKKLSLFLKASLNPWETVLYLVTHAGDYAEAKTSTLSFIILSEFHKWVDSPDNHLRGREADFVSEELRVQVLFATTGRHMPYFNSAVKAFKLDHPGNECLIPVARSFLSQNKLTEVE